MNLLKMKAARVASGRTVKEAAEYIGVSPNMYSKKESGFSKFSIEEFEKLVVFFDLNMVQIDDILFDYKVPFGTFPVPLA